MEPAAFDQAYDLVRRGGDDRGAALSADDFVAEKENVGELARGQGGSVCADGRGVEVDGPGGERGGVVALRDGELKSFGVFGMGGAERLDGDRVSCGGLGVGERQGGDGVAGVEGIWRGAENGDVVDDVGGHDGNFYEARRSVRTTEQDAGLAAIAEFAEDVGGGEQVAVAIDEEGVAVKDVMVAVASGGIVELVDDGADGGRDGGGLRGASGFYGFCGSRLRGWFRGGGLRRGMGRGECDG